MSGKKAYHERMPTCPNTSAPNCCTPRCPVNMVIAAVFNARVMCHDAAVTFRNAAAPYKATSSIPTSRPCTSRECTESRSLHLRRTYQVHHELPDPQACPLNSAHAHNPLRSESIEKHSFVDAEQTKILRQPRRAEVFTLSPPFFLWRPLPQRASRKNSRPGSCGARGGRRCRGRNSRHTLA